VVVGVIVAVAVMAGVCVIVLVTVSMPVVVAAAAGVLMLVSVSVALGVCVSVLMAVRVAVRMAAATGVVMLVSVRMAVGVIVRMPFSFAVRMPASGPFTVCPVVIMGMRVLVPFPFHNGDIRLMIVPAIPAAVRMVMVFPRRVSMRLMTGMTMFMVIGFLQNPLWVGVSARFAVFVTVRFGVAGVRHGGFLARFVV